MNTVAKYKYQLLLLLVVLVAYFPLTFFQSTLLNDDIDVALSTKYFAGECLQNGYLPLWNPYQIWGFPAHADLQYTNWNLETLLTGILFGYNYIILHILFILYLFLAALGAFLLTRYLSKNAKTAFYMACVYVLSGLVTAHIQSLVTILGLVWLPYVVLYFFKWLHETTLKNTLLLCVFSYLLMTLGYQAFVFMLIPPFAIFYVHSIMAYYNTRNIAAIKQKILYAGLAVIILLLLLSPVFFTQVQAQPFVSRLNGMRVEDVMSNPLSPLSVVSFINPVLTIGHDAWFNTEVTMRNVFIGTFPLLLLIVALFKKKKTAFDLILLSVAACYLLGSFGDVIPVRKLMYYVLPGFKLFRFPSLLRVVAILLLMCYWAVNFNSSIEFLYTQKRKRNALLLVTFLMNVIVLCFCFLKLDRYTFFDHIYHGFNNRITHADPLEITFYVSLIQLLLMSVAFILLSRATDEHKFKNKIIGITLAELTVVVLLYGQYTAFTNLKPAHFQENLAKLQKGFPFPSSDALFETAYKFDYLHGFWKNTGGFKKQLVIEDAWTSFYFRNYEYLITRLPNEKDSLLSYPFAYVSKPLAHETTIAIPVDTGMAFIKNTMHYKNAVAKLQYSFFAPQNIVLNVKANDPVVLNLQQSYYTGWRVWVDGVERPLLWNAGLLMSVDVPEGLHTVTFTYHNNTFTIALAISYGVLILLFMCCIYYSNYSKKNKQLLMFLFISFTVMVLTLFFTRHGKRDYAVKNGFTFNRSSSSVYYDFNSKTDIALCLESFKTKRPKNVHYQWHNYYNSPELVYALGIDPEYTQQDLQALEGDFSYTPLNEKALQLLAHIKFDSTYTDKTFIDTTPLNGYALLLNEQQNPYSTLIPVGMTKLKGHDLYGNVTLKAIQLSNALVVCKIKHADGAEESLYFPLNKYLINTADWQTIPYYFNLKNVIEPQDTVNLFLMNAVKHAVFVKELKVEWFK